jgi:hypothetical protein
VKLPLWRLIAGLAVLGGFAAVLILLAPVYIDNFRLRGYVRALADAPNAAAMPDDGLRAQVLVRAHELDLPVQAGDVKITHNGRKPHVETVYKVKMTLYPVDLHMSANSR